MTTNKKPHTIHKTDMVINKNKLKNILDSKDMEYIDLWNKVADAYGLDLSYKGFMSLLSNRSTWKLLYAWAIIDILKIEIVDIFDIIAIDVEEKAKEKAKWKKKYQN